MTLIFWEVGRHYGKCNLLVKKMNSRNKDEGKLDLFEDSVNMILGTKG